MSTRARKTELVLSALGLLAVGLLYVLWLPQHDYPPYARLAAFLSAALFSVLGLRFVPRWVAFWSKGGAVPSPRPEEPSHMGAKLFLALLGFDALVLLSAWLLRLALGYEESFVDSLRSWRCADAVHYLDIARDWYLSEGSVDRLVQLVFLPGYPLLLRLLIPLTGSDLAAGLLVSALCFAGAGSALYRLLRLELPHADALRGVFFLCLTPGSFFFAAPMSESLFLLLCVLCLYLARTDRWLPGCLCGMMAAFTRSLGITLLVPLVMELVHAAVNGECPRQRTALRAFALLLVPAGFGLYCYVNYLTAGNPFQFMIYQAEHWGQRLGLFFNTAAYQTQLAAESFGGSAPLFWGLWLPNLLASFGALALTALAAKKLRPSYTAWFIAYYVVAIGATWLLSAPRYLAALPVLPASLAVMTEKRAPRRAAQIVFPLLWLPYFLAFLARWQVW